MAPQPQLKCLFLSKRERNKPKGYILHSTVILSGITTTFMQTRIIRVGYILYLESGIPKLVKVKAHKRFINGKVVKVRSHYRSVWGRQVDAGILYR